MSEAPFAESFVTRVSERIQRLGGLCVGIDPHPALLTSWELPDSVEGLRSFGQSVVETLGAHVAALKPQVALYERHGSGGIAVLEELLEECRAREIPTIADAKRGDIGSTMLAYAQAWLSADSPLRADSLTVSPYLGFGSLTPALDLAREQGRGIFVLALTSNPEGAQVQHRGGQDSVAKAIVDQARAYNAHEIEASGGQLALGSVGLVIGATVEHQAAALGLELPNFNGLILAPGFGAQGGSITGLRTLFGASRAHVLVNSSREILAQGPDPVKLFRAAIDTQEALIAS